MKLIDPIYTDENKAREHFEKLHWPDGPICPHCGSIDNAAKLEGKSTRPGVYKCRDCRKPFSVTVGTVMERSHIKLNVWLAAMHLITARKKGMSAHQMHRMLGIGYEAAWFLCHRLRHAMDDPKAGPIEADETGIGGSKVNRAFAKKPPKKHPVISLIERSGASRSFHIANVNVKTLRPIIVKIASRKSHFVTDEALWYVRIGDEFASHMSVNQALKEYVRDGKWHTNNAENYFSILKRGIYGVYHHVCEVRLQRYLAEFDFRYSNRAAVGVTDVMRAEKAIKGMVGKRLTYRRPSSTEVAPLQG